MTAPAFLSAATGAPESASPNEELVEYLVPIAAELVGTVRDYGPDMVAAVLARVPDGRHDALAVVLAAMVDPDARPGHLLAWTEGPVQSREGFDPSRRLVMCPDCSEVLRESSLARHATRLHGEYARLTAAGVSTDAAAVLAVEAVA